MSQYKEGLGVVYKIENLVNGKVYIGQTTRYQRRKRDHLNFLTINNHINKNLQKDFNKYGEEQFNITIIKECKTLQERLYWEKYYIDLYGGIESKSTYNMTDKDSSNQQVKLKISKSNKGKVRTQAYKNKNSKNKIIYYNTSEGKLCKKQISKSVKMYYQTEEGQQQRKNSSERCKKLYRGSYNTMYNKNHTESTKQKISETKKSKHYIPWNKGKKGLYKHSEQTLTLLKQKSTKYTLEDINYMKQLYNELGTYSAVGKKLNINSNIVSRLIRFGTTSCYK